MKNLVKLVCVTSVLAVLAISAAAQSAATAELHILVKDQNGALVNNATVSALNQAQSFTRRSGSSSNGEYQFAFLPPGQYTITVEAPGFAKFLGRDVIVTVGQLATLPVTLRVAGTAETVEVSSEAELVETQRTSSTTTIDQRRIDNLPINGRNYINFALTDSQIARDTAPSIGAAPTSGLNFGGQRARQNLVNVDGADAVDNSVNGIRSTVSQEAVQEFQIIKNSYSAEYGRASGGVVNIITRSGSNAFHGNVFGFLRNRNLQAVNPFSNVSDPAYTRVQAGLTLGGPIKKDKTFYFFSYETTRRRETGFSNIGANNFGFVPFDTTLVGQPFGTLLLTQEQVAFLTNPATIAMEKASPAFAMAVAQYTGLAGGSAAVALNGALPASLGGFPVFPTSNALLPSSFVPLNSIVGNYPISEGTSLYSLRLDHRLTNSQQVSLRGNVSPSTTTGIQVNAQGPQNFGQNAFSRTSEQTYRDVTVAGQDTWTLGANKVNEFRFQYARRGLLYNFSHAPGGGSVAVNIPGFAFFGREPFSFVDRTEQRYQATDNFSWIHGNHSLRFGLDGNFIPLTANFTVNFGGVYNFGAVNPFPQPFPAFSAVQAYGAGLPSNFIQGVGNPHDAFTNVPLGGFIQDSWRLRPNLTLNYGVRYEVELTPTFAAINPLSQAAQNSLGITQGIPRDTNNVAPRLGIAWDPGKDGKTVVRASYGLFYDHPLLALAFDSDVADAAQAPQMVLFGGAPCTAASTPSPLNMNAANTFQGTLGNANCTPPGFAQATNYLAGQQRFNPTPNAPSAFVGQQYLAAGIPLVVQPFGFPTSANFQYPYSNQANLTIERDLGHDFALSLQYNFNGGRHLNRPINANAVRSDLLIRNWQVAAAAGDPAAVGGGGAAPLLVGSSGAPCGVDMNPGPFAGQPWVSAALVSFFRPSGLNPSLARGLIAQGGAGCVQLAQQILSAEGLNSTCDPLSLSGCIPFSDMPANFSNGSSVYHGFTANLKKRFSDHYEFLISYTYSHAIDDSTDLESPLSPQDNYRPNLDRSTSLFDQRHRFVFSGMYQTGRVSGDSVWSKVASNWTFAPIIEAGAGRPFNIIVGSDRNFDFGTTTDRPLTVGSGAPPNACGDSAMASSFSPTGFLQPACFLSGTLTGNLSRNAGVRPMTLFTDMRIARRIQLGERLALDGMVDVFNFINRFNVADVNPLWSDAGRPTAAFDPRQFQLALKLSW
ncbi:MAG TPA: carboxypeptidase regulatory-like domain-containing protein [Terriglobales bacterium]|nr:carboxypeptidase regulatory-like domain-containing protein [Terriglobales bacterium]